MTGKGRLISDQGHETCVGQPGEVPGPRDMVTWLKTGPILGGQNPPSETGAGPPGTREGQCI